MHFFILFFIHSPLFRAIFLAFSPKTPTFAVAKNDEMRKFLLSLVLLLAFSALISGTFTGCRSEEKPGDTIDTAVVKPQQLKSMPEEGDTLDEKTVTGTVIDGSQNMVIMETPSGDSKEFNYNSDNYEPSDMYDWDLDENNKITVTYVELQPGVDSVIRIEKAQ